MQLAHRPVPPLSHLAVLGGMLLFAASPVSAQRRAVSARLDCAAFPASEGASG